MSLFIHFLKRIFAPSFTYEFCSSVPDDSYIETAIPQLTARKACFVLKTRRHLSFYIRSSVVWGGFSSTKLLTDIEDIGNEEYKFRVQLITARRLFYIFASIISAWVVLLTMTADSPEGLIMIPIVFLQGHVYLWSVLAAKGRKIRNFFLRKIGERG